MPFFAAEDEAKTITTGMIALGIGFGFWWIYFDLVGRRPPRDHGSVLANWLISHLPITLSITAAGVAMVSLIRHADDPRTPAGTAWLSSPVALGLLALITTALLVVVILVVLCASPSAASSARTHGATRPTRDIREAADSPEVGVAPT